jgi:ribosomal protein L37AE/L43A
VTDLKALMERDTVVFVCDHCRDRASTVRLPANTWLRPKCMTCGQRLKRAALTPPTKSEEKR